MPTYFFNWTPEALEHIDEHGVTPEEFEAVVQNPITVDTSKTSGRPIAFGCIDGRAIACVYEQVDSMTIFPVTAFEVD